MEGLEQTAPVVRVGEFRLGSGERYREEEFEILPFLKYLCDEVDILTLAL